jgi:hypothetical protein
MPRSAPKVTKPARKLCAAKSPRVWRVRQTLHEARDVQRGDFRTPESSGEGQQKQRAIAAAAQTVVESVQDVFQQLGSESGLLAWGNPVRSLDALEDLAHNRVGRRCGVAMQLVLLRDRHRTAADRRDSSLTGEIREVQRDGLRRRGKRRELVLGAIAFEVALIACVGLSGRFARASWA